MQLKLIQNYNRDIICRDTFLHSAAEYDRIEMVKKLLEYGADRCRYKCSWMEWIYTVNVYI